LSSHRNNQSWHHNALSSHRNNQSWHHNALSWHRNNQSWYHNTLNSHRNNSTRFVRSRLPKSKNIFFTFHEKMYANVPMHFGLRETQNI
jgi:hypothetical protein